MELNRVEGRFVRRNLDGDGATTLPRNAGAAEKKLQPRQLRPFTRKGVAEAMTAIMDRFVEEATNGSVAHTKVLVSLIWTMVGNCVDLLEECPHCAHCVP